MNKIMKKDLIYDGEYVRHCSSNLAKMNVFEVVTQIKQYSYSSLAFTIVNMLEEVVESVSVILTFILYIVFFPVVPFVRAHTNISRAKNDMKKWNQSQSKDCKVKGE